MKVSILMSVYNGLPYVHESIASVLAQTFPDWELLIVNDTSTDMSPEEFDKFATDPRIKIWHNTTNLGLTKSLNRIMAYAQGEFIARIDADDIWMENKLELQINFMTLHPEIGILGGADSVVGLEGIVQKVMPQTDKEIRASLYKTSPFVHSAVFFRKTLVEQLGSYNPAYRNTQDYDLWCRFLLHTQGANLPQVVVKRYRPLTAITILHWKKSEWQILQIMWHYYPQYNQPWYRYLHLVYRAARLLLPKQTKQILNRNIRPAISRIKKLIINR
jgi:glycosyltransferase involved in cell wall biosynthesis